LRPLEELAQDLTTDPVDALYYSHTHRHLMTFLSGLETYFLFFIGVYAVNQVWNVFTKERTQTEMFIDALRWTTFWIIFDKVVGI
jgi:hypothetical protein